MIRNDLHVHSLQSLCGMHTMLEIVEIAAKKGMRMVNICDHGSASGKKMNFGVLANKKRCPKQVHSADGTEVIVLAGIEANIIDIHGHTDLPEKVEGRFDLISAGFHSSAKELLKNQRAEDNTRALENYLKENPLDILTHPCIARFPLDIEQVVKLARKHDFALEVNNTNLRVEKTVIPRLLAMIRMARDEGVTLIENSDGHTFFEIGENDRIEALLEENGIDGDELFINRDDAALDRFLEHRLTLRESS